MLDWLVISLMVLTISLLYFKGFIFGQSNVSHIPGPRGIPIFGNALQMELKSYHHWITDEMKKYGHIIKLKLLNTVTVVVSGKEEIKQVLVTKGNDFAGRPVSFRTTQAYPKIFVFEDYTNDTRLQKKTLMKYFKAYGQGIAELEKLTLTVATNLLQDLDKFAGNPISITSNVRNTLIDMIYILLFHRRVPADELPHLINITQMSEHVFQVGGAGTLLDLFPLLRYCNVPIWAKFQQMIASESLLFNKWKQRYLENENEYKGTYLEVLFQHNKENPHEAWDDVVMTRHLTTIFIGGISTSTITLSSLTNQLARNQELQKTLYAENKKVLGDRKVTLTDRPNMPCHESTLYETLRYYSLLPLTLPHKAVKDTEINGCKIPKGTDVWVNMYAYSHDESYWDEPYEFKPSRFTDEEGKMVTDASRLYFFGAGPRVCAGEVFAKNRLFLMLSSIVQKFEILPATTIDEQPSCDVRDAKMDFFLNPGDIKVRMKRRE